MRIDKETVVIAQKAGLVIVYGAGDDLMEFDGVFRDEVGCYDGGTAYLNGSGLLENKCECDGCPHFRQMKNEAATIKALWCDGGGYSWTYETDIPHVTFDVMEDGEKYCRGIVFALADVSR